MAGVAGSNSDPIDVQQKRRVDVWSDAVEILSTTLRTHREVGSTYRCLNLACIIRKIFETVEQTGY